MHTMKAVAVVLLVVGILALAWGGISWTQKEKVVDLGPVEINREKRETIPLPPMVGIAALIAGGVLLVSSRRSA